MAFEEISKGRFTGKEAIQNRVAISPQVNNTLKILVSNDIYKSLGAPMFFKVGIGSGKHAGLIALIPTSIESANAYRASVSFKGRGQAAISVSAKNLGVTVSEMTALPFEITDAGLAIDIRPLRKPALAAAE